MTKEQLEKDQELQEDVEIIQANRFLSIYGKKRTTPNDFTNLIEAIENFKMELFRSLKIPDCVEWLSKQLNKYDKKIRNN